MSLSKYKFNAGDKWPAENASSIDPDSISLTGLLTGGTSVSPLTKWGDILKPTGETEEITQTNSGGAQWDIRDDDIVSQSFKATKGYLMSATFYITIWTGTPSDLTIEVYNADASENPTGSVLDSVELDKDEVSNGGSPFKVNFNRVSLTVGNKYCFVFKSPDSNGSNYYKINTSSSNTYPDGTLKYSLNGGSSWNSVSSDIYMKVNMATSVNFLKYSINIDNTDYDDNILSLPYESEGTDLFVGGSGNERAFYDEIQQGQTFETVSKNLISKIVLRLKKYSSAYGTLTVGIYATSGGFPTGSALATATLNIATELTTSYQDIELTLSSSILLNSNTKYAIVLTPPAYPQTTSSQYVSAQCSTSDIYSNGNVIEKVSSNPWTNVSIDLYFKIIGEKVPTFDEIASALQEQIRELTSGNETVEYSTNKFIIKSDKNIEKMTSPSSGTDISGNTSDGASGYYLDLGTNATQTPKTDDDFNILRLDGNTKIPKEVFVAQSLTTAQRDALLGVRAGQIIFNSTTNKLNFYNGTSWEAITSS